MSRLQVRPFEAEDVPEAAALLAERHRRHRLALPLLAARYEDVDVAAAEVTAASAVENSSGAVALRSGQMVGFLLGAPSPQEVWGPNVWVEAAGQAATDTEVMRDLYAVAATRWVDEGRTAQYVLVPATDVDLLRAWFRLGFGQQQCHGLREVAIHRPAVVPEVTIRRATREDVPVLVRLDMELPLHQSLAPTFSGGRMPTAEQSRIEWEADVDDPEYATFVAERHGEVIGSAVGCALEKSNRHTGLARPDNAAFLGFAAVLPNARGAGAGRALGEAVLAWAAEGGFASMVTDWRVTNLLSSRAWPALGFAEAFLRLHRTIGY
jgi:GNAT superfamily N-acetyltransferase